MSPVSDTQCSMPPLWARWWLRVSVACVWFYQGLWHKVVALDDRHHRIMASALGESIGRMALPALGLLETAIGLAVLLRFLPMMVACGQIGLLVLMNGGGLLFAWADIPDPVGMITMNLVFVAAVWMNGWLTLRERRSIADRS